MIRFALFSFLVLFFMGPAYGQAPEKRFVGNCSFSGFALVSDSTYRGNITRFDDRMGDGYNLTQLATGYEIFDGRGLVFSIGTIHSSTNFTADVTVTAKADRGFEPFGSGQVYNPTASGMIPPSSQEQAGLSPTQKARIDRHNVVKMEALVGGRDSVYSIMNVPDTTSLSPVTGDAFINATADTLGLYDSSGWVLFYGGSGGSTETADGATILGDGSGTPFYVNTDSLHPPMIYARVPETVYVPGCASTVPINISGMVVNSAIRSGDDITGDITISGAGGLTITYIQEEDGFAYFESQGSLSAGVYGPTIGYAGLELSLLMNVIAQPCYTDTLTSYVDRTELGDSTAAVRADFPAGDNLGDHTATTDLDMDGNNIQLGGGYVIGGAGTGSDLILQSTSGVGAGSDDIIFLTGNNGSDEAMRIKGSGNVGIGTDTPQKKLHVAGTARITSSDGMPTALMGRDGDGDIGAVTLGAGLTLAGGELSSNPDSSVYATQNYVRTYHNDEIITYLADDTLANPVVFTVDTIKEINVISYQSVPQGISSNVNIATAPIGRYLFHLTATRSQYVDFSSNFKLASNEFADDGGEHFLFKDQMWDCYSNGTDYYCNTPSYLDIYDPFVFRVNTENPGVSGDSTFIMPFASGTTNDFIVSWGDGIEEEITSDTVMHTYAAPGVYNITVTGLIGNWAFNNSGDKSKMVEIIEWGDFTLVSNAFYGCDSMQVSATDGPIFSTDLSNAFRGCSSLTSLDVSKFVTNNVTNMSLMFYNCTALTSLDLSSFETASVTRMGSMFYNCSALTSLDVSGFVTNSVTDMGQMFYNCSSLTSLDVSGFVTNNVTNMGQMFYNCSSLTSLDVSGFSTGNVTNMNGMFYNCSGLASLDVSGFSTGSVTNMGGMFRGCSSLTSLDVTGFAINSVTNMSQMFFGVTLPTATYDALLVAWEAQSVQNNVNFSGGNSTYTLSSAAATARAALISDHTWTITDGGGI